MPNNPNQNLTQEENHPKKTKGFPGMEIPKGKSAKTSVEVSEARKANVKATEKHHAEGKNTERKRPF